MFNWAKQQLANVAGTQEPIYGPSAIQSVAEESKTTPYTELKKEDFKWQNMDSTSVETQVFYLMSESGYIGLAQIIHSNVMGIQKTCQFNSKVFYLDGSQPHLWCSQPLEKQEFSEDQTSYYATDCAVELSKDGNSYSIKSMTDERAIVNLKITKTAPAFHAGKTGKSNYGTDPAEPWGSMRHAFWPRCVAEGTITTKDGPIDFKGKALFIHALQGMKPHHAAATWNFLDFQGPTYSAVMMQYTTPPSYGSTVVCVGAIVKDGEIIVAGSGNEGFKVEHTAIKEDAENEWKVPTAVRYTWTGTNKDGKKVEAKLEGELAVQPDRVDVMAEVPKFVKSIVAGAAGTKPYIYQFTPPKDKLDLKIKIGDEAEVTEKGQTYTEATFISAT